MFKDREQTVMLLLRVGVAFAFIYPAVAAFFEPLSWIGYFPGFMRDLFPSDELLLNLFGLSELVIALWILIGKRIFIPSILASVYLFFIVVLNMAVFDVTFRDVPIFLMAVALAVWSYKQGKEQMQEPPPQAA